MAPQARVLVAGIGNVFFGDDGFGVEVVQRLAAAPLPDGVRVMDAGIRGVHLAYELADGAYDMAILVDATPRGGAPGTLYLLEPERGAAADHAPAAMDGHGLTPAAVLELLEKLGSPPARIVVLGCEPAVIDERMELSAPVAAAVDEAVATVRRLVTEAAGLQAGVT